MRGVAVLPIVLMACHFRHGILPDADDGGVDAPPTTTQVYFTLVTSDVTEVRPGQYGVEVTAVLRNDLDVEIENVGATLTFAGSEDQFRWRDVDRREGVAGNQPVVVAPRSEATYQFIVDVLPWAVPPGPVAINGAATFEAGATALSAAPSQTPLSLAFAPSNPPIVVTLASDEIDSDADVSLREALARANTTPGLDRITFSPSAFPPGTVLTLSSALGELPTVTSDLVIDGGDANVTLALDPAWQTPEGRYGLRIASGNVAVARLGFKNFAFNYRDESITTPADNCGVSNTQLEGGAIRVDGGTLVLEGNRFADPDVAERNCWAASVRFHGGSGHRIVGNTWTDQVMDSIYVAAHVVEITDNVMASPAHTERNDESIYIASQGGQDLWVVGNLCVDNEFSAVYAGGTDAGTLYVVNNTFARNGRSSLGGLRRGGATRQVVLRNNVYIANNPAALLPDAAGAMFDIGYESVTGSPLCEPACTSATIDMFSMATPGDPGVSNMQGSSPADFTPTTGSPLVGIANGWLDRNGRLPRRYNGAGQERGAIELP